MCWCLFGYGGVGIGVGIVIGDELYVVVVC